jgi:hypothetical protein
MIFRGVPSTIAKRYARANNPHMEDYNENEKTSYLSYIDANNLYGYSMSQSLPVGGFEWKADGEFTLESIREYDSTSDKG